MSFDEDELRRINDAELIIGVGVSIQDLGYQEMSLQLEHDLLEIKNALNALEHGKMPNMSPMATPAKQDDKSPPRDWNWK